MTINRYVTTMTVRHNGLDYPPGTPMALSDDYANPLKKAGSIIAQAGALPTMPTVLGDVVRQTVSSADGGTAEEYLKVKTTSGGRVEYSAAGVAISLAEAPAYSDRLLSFAVGNSICWNGTWGFTTANMFDQRSEIAAANAFHGLSYFSPTVTPVALVDGVTAGVDACGSIGLPGEKTDKIYRDVLAIGFPAHDAAGFVPEMCYMVALYENDIAWDYDIAGVKSRVLNLIDTVRAKYPGIIIHLGTSRADSRLTTPSRVAAAVEMRRWIKLLDNNRDIFVTDFWIGSYSDIANPTGLTLQYTDANVHPNGIGAWANGRLIAETNKRISRVAPKLAKRARSANFGFVGSNAVATAGFSGTIPNAVTLPTALTGTSACVMTAGNPGPLNVKFTPGNTTDNALIRMSLTAGLPTGPVGGVISVRVNSGAENLWDVYPRLRLNGAPIISAALKGQNSGRYSGSFKNGDVLQFVVPPIAVPGTFTAVQHDIYIYAVGAGVTIDLDILSMGYLDHGST
jgi:hypothetical protein